MVVLAQRFEFVRTLELKNSRKYRDRRQYSACWGVEDGELEVGRHVEGPEKAFTAIIAVQLISRQRRLWFVLCSNRHLQVQEYPWSYQSPSTSVRIFQKLLFLLFATYDVMLFVRVEKPPSLAMLQRFQTGWVSYLQRGHYRIVCIFILEFIRRILEGDLEERSAPNFNAVTVVFTLFRIRLRFAKAQTSHLSMWEDLYLSSSSQLPGRGIYFYLHLANFPVVVSSEMNPNFRHLGLPWDTESHHHRVPSWVYLDRRRLWRAQMVVGW